MGASDRRYIPIHEGIFTSVIGRPVKMTTLDIDTRHLDSGAGTTLHDVTTPFPLTADVAFSHELMKFLTTSEQIAAIINAHLALNAGGFAMHIIHEPSIKGTKELRYWQQRVDPDKLVEMLKIAGVLCAKLFFKIESSVDWLRETTVLVTKKDYS